MLDTDNTQAKMEGLATLLILDDEIRKLASLREFGFFTTNETHRLIPYQTAFLWQHKQLRVRLLAESGTPEIDHHAFPNQWLEETIAKIRNQPTANTVHEIQIYKEFPVEESTEENKVEIGAHGFPNYCLWCPLFNKNQEITGGLLLFRDTPYTEPEVKMLSWLLASYQYTWQILAKPKQLSLLNYLHNKSYIAPAAITVAAICLFPVRLSVLGTGIVVAKNPVLINAPMTGVIKSFSVSPGETVKAGQLLLTLDKTDLQASVEVNKRDLLLTQAKLRTAINESFERKENISNIPILQAQLSIDKAHLDYTKTLLDKTDITSPIDGIVIFDSKEDWLGQPVQTGERILTVSNPSQVSLKIYLPVANSIVDLSVGADGEFYLYGQLRSLAVKVRALGYNAKLTPNKILSYQLVADFKEKNDKPQLGAQGTVRLYGSRVPFIYYLLRRPIQSFRQTLGI